MTYSGVHPHPDDEPGYVVGWKYKYKFERGKLEGEMTFAEARRKAEELGEKEPDKVFWAEKKLDIPGAQG